MLKYLIKQSDYTLGTAIGKKQAVEYLKSTIALEGIPTDSCTWISLPFSIRVVAVKDGITRHFTIEEDM